MYIVQIGKCDISTHNSQKQREISPFYYDNDGFTEARMIRESEYIVLHCTIRMKALSLAKDTKYKTDEKCKVFAG